MSPRHVRTSAAVAHALDYAARAPATLVKREPASLPATPAPSPSLSLSPGPSTSAHTSSPSEAPSPLPGTPPPADSAGTAWQLIPYDVPWGADFADYAAGTLPGPEGACLFLRSPTPVEKRRAAQACELCRERKAKCSGDRPACLRCIEKGQECAYAAEPRRPAAPPPVPPRRKTTAGASTARGANDHRPYPRPRQRPQASSSFSPSFSTSPTAILAVLAGLPHPRPRSPKHEPSDAWPSPATGAAPLAPGSRHAYAHTIHAPTPRRASPAVSFPAVTATAAAAAIAGFGLEFAERGHGVPQAGDPLHSHTAYVDVDVDYGASDNDEICGVSVHGSSSPDARMNTYPTYPPAPVHDGGYAYLAAAAADHYTYTHDYTHDYSESYSTPISSFSTLAHALHYPYDAAGPACVC